MLESVHHARKSRLVSGEREGRRDWPSGREERARESFWVSGSSVVPGLSSMTTRRDWSHALRHGAGSG